MAGAAAIGALEAPDAARFASHAAVCHLCAEDLADLQEATSLLGLSAPAADPSAKLRRRILADARREPRGRERRMRWPRVVVAPLAAICLIAVSAMMLPLGGDAGPPGPRSAFAVAGEVRAEVVMTAEGRRALLGLDGLPAAGAGHGYAVWRLGERGGAEFAGFLGADAGGQGLIAVGDLDGVRALAVTRERLGPVQGPAGAPLVAVDIPA